MSENNIKKISFLENSLNYLTVFIVFSGAFVFQTNRFFEMRAAYFVMGLVLFFWLPIMKDIVFNKIFFIPFFLLVFLSLYNVYLGFDSLSLLVKQAIGICVNAIWFYMFIKINRYDIKRLFRIYLNIAFIIALIGIIQESSYLLQFRPGYDYSAFLPFWTFYPTGNFIRVNSICSEPASFCIAIMPALFASFCSLMDRENRMIGKIRSVVIITAFILSFSSTGYLGLIITFFIILINYMKIRHTLVILVSGAMFLFLAFQNSIDFRTRVVDSVSVLSSKTTLDKVNLSTFALYNNALIVYGSFKAKPFIGSGLGSHELNYEKYTYKIPRIERGVDYVNNQDAASLFLRLLSETGILGVTLFIFFLAKYYMKKQAYPVDLWVINNAIFVFFVVRLLRAGHYFTEGLFLFFWMYYFSKVISMQRYRNT